MSIFNFWMILALSEAQQQASPGLQKKAPTTLV
jgi:hypothetical protein